jgi:hypothetical protein
MRTRMSMTGSKSVAIASGESGDCVFAARFGQIGLPRTSRCDRRSTNSVCQWEWWQPAPTKAAKPYPRPGPGQQR